MTKRTLIKLAKAGYFNSANGTLYAATKYALRKKPTTNDFDVTEELNRDALPRSNLSLKAVHTFHQTSPSNVMTRSQKEIALM